MALLLLQFHQNQRDNQILRQQISKALGFSVEQKDFQKYTESGMQPEEEPLASFLKAESFKKPEMLNDISSFDLIPTLEQEKINQLVLELNEKAPGYEETIFAFTAAQPRKIAHKIDWENESAYSLLLPELEKLSAAARFLVLQIYVAPQDRERVIRNNTALTALRDWALKGENLISMLVGFIVRTSKDLSDRLSVNLICLNPS